MSLRQASALLLLSLYAACAALSGCSDEKSEPTQVEDPGPAVEDGGGEADSGPTADGEAVDLPGDGGEAADPGPPAPVDLLLSVPETESWSLPGLRAPVHVVRTEGNVPHIYAESRHDLALVQGFVTARDRYLMLDLGRRLARGNMSALLGEIGLSSDLESRLLGMSFIAERIAAGFSGELLETAAAFAAGVNAYIEAVREERAAPPTELKLAGSLLGSSDPADLMDPFDIVDIGALITVVIFESSFHGGEIGRSSSAAALSSVATGAPFEELRKAGVLEDVWGRVAPARAVSSTAGFGLEGAGGLEPGPMPSEHPGAVPGASTQTPRPQHAGAALTLAMPPGMLDALDAELEAFERRLGRSRGADFGSNCWAMGGAATKDGAGLLAGDGHLPLDVPSIFYQVGLDTSVLGGEDTHQLGLVIPTLPILAVGTNGSVAWSQTQLRGDVADWYREELRLGDDGLPLESLFKGEWKALERVDEAYVVKAVPILGSEGRTETHPRFVTFDGRMIVDVEGREAEPDTVPGEGEALVATTGGFVIPGDSDGDGKLTAVSYDYAAFDLTSVIEASDAFGHARNVEEMREASRRLFATSQNICGADSEGGVFYTVFEATPCRGYLERDEEGRWVEGANPMMLLDGTRYGGFEIPTKDGNVDYEAGETDPYRCVIPFESTPQALNPERGFILNANNDPGGIATDNALWDDPWYIGGPWDTGYRADRIRVRLEALAGAGDADAESMAAVQADDTSNLGERFAPLLLDAIEVAKRVHDTGESHGLSETRLGVFYAADAAAFDEVAERLRAWGERGYRAASGVETFYHQLGPDEPEDAVATQIFNAWLPRFLRAVWDDEGIPGGAFWRGYLTKVALTDKLLAARDAGEAMGFASFNPETGESVFFDLAMSPEVETSRELMLQALIESLSWLRTEPTMPGVGGFGTADMSAWLWGLRHQVRFESLLAGYIGSDPRFKILTDSFAIDTKRLPLADTMEAGDPRAGLRWFPRPGDNYGVDAANPGFSGTSFSFRYGPVMRMVFALHKDGRVTGKNIVPGGQSALTDSPHFDDQAALWLGNEAFPARFHLADVVEGASGREAYLPAEE